MTQQNFLNWMSVAIVLALSACASQLTAVTQLTLGVVAVGKAAQPGSPHL